jgi:hypothetical protein
VVSEASTWQPFAVELLDFLAVYPPSPQSPYFLMLITKTQTDTCTSRSWAKFWRDGKLDQVMAMLSICCSCTAGRGNSDQCRFQGMLRGVWHVMCYLYTCRLSNYFCSRRWTAIYSIQFPARSRPYFSLRL